jgi:hypothetical protein
MLGENLVEDLTAEVRFCERDLTDWKERSYGETLGTGKKRKMRGLCGSSSPIEGNFS